MTIYEYVKDSRASRDQQGCSRASGSPSAVQEDERGQRELDRRVSEVMFSSLLAFFLHQFPGSTQRGKGKKKETGKMGTRQKGSRGAVLDLPRGGTQ